jgi:dolichyl-phosphate-mannose--protein O-mannosyl transferase
VVIAALERRVPALGDRWSVVDSGALVGVTLLATVLRLRRVDVPSALMFDETYYAKDACWYAFASEQICGVASEQTAVHPPLGKWLLAAGVRAFGYTSLGWRVAAALAGAATVTLLFVLGRKLLGSTLAALVAASGLAIDPLHFVQSRIAMLDVFVTGFGVAAFTFLLCDRNQSIGAHSSPLPAIRVRPWRIAAGTAAGAALASKWSGALVVVAAVALSVTWAVAIRRREGGAHPVARALRHEGASIAWWLVVWPLLIYAATYVGRLEGAILEPPGASGAWLRELWERQAYMYDFHSNLAASHSFQSPPWSWPLLKRPVSYFFAETPSGDYREVLATGNPLAWWAALVSLAIVAGRWLRTRDVASAEGFILAGFALLYGPWMVLAGDRSAVFLFYLLPALPFMYLALGYLTVYLRPRRWRSPAVALFGVGVAALFVFYHPLLVARGIPYEDWRTRIWVFDNCDKPPPVATETTTTATRRDDTIVRTATTKSAASLPPTGWCWI